MSNAKIIEFKKPEENDILRILKQVEEEAEHISEIVIITKHRDVECYGHASYNVNSGTLDYMNVIRDRFMRSDKGYE